MSTTQHRAEACLIIVRTESSGLLAAAAYDVTVASKGASVVAEVDREDPARSTAAVEIPVASFEAHALHRHRDRQAAKVSASDARQIGGKTSDKLREAFGSTIRVELGAGKAQGGGKLSFSAKVADRATLPLEVEASLGEGRVELRARARASLKALGVPKVKGPLGSLVVSDPIEIEIEATLVPAT